jgi:hypothetical protein
MAFKEFKFKEVPRYLSLTLASVEFSFEGLNLDERTGLANALSHVTKAMGVIGWMEHTADWDPVLVIDTTDGRLITDSHYYEVEAPLLTKDGNYLVVEAPDKISEVESLVEFWESGYYYIPLELIKLITIDTQ